MNKCLLLFFSKRVTLLLCGKCCTCTSSEHSSNAGAAYFLLPIDPALGNQPWDTGVPNVLFDNIVCIRCAFFGKLSKYLLFESATHLCVLKHGNYLTSLTNNEVKRFPLLWSSVSRKALTVTVLLGYLDQSFIKQVKNIAKCLASLLSY